MADDYINNNVIQNRCVVGNQNLGSITGLCQIFIHPDMNSKDPQHSPYKLPALDIVSFVACVCHITESMRQAIGLFQQ